MAIANITDLLKGAGKAVGEALRDGKYYILSVIAGVDLYSALEEYHKTGQFRLNPIPEGIADLIAGPIGEAERVIGQPLFELLVRAPTGAKLSGEAGNEEAIAVNMVERMLGFAIALPYATAQIKTFLRATLGENGSEAFAEALDKIPEEIGINWALGNVLDRILEVAAGQPIEEAIALQTRPARLEWPQIRALGRMHAIPRDVLRERLANTGFRDSDIDLIEKIDRTLLSVQELQGAYLYNILSEDEIRSYLDQLGYEPDDANVIIETYLTKAETAGGNQLRAVAQRGYLDGHISEAQYRDILKQVNVPDKSIDAEIEASNLAKSFGRIQLNASAIKQLVVDGLVNDVQARQRLLDIGYTEEDANLLISEWHTAKKLAHTGLNENKILSYLISGVLEPAEAYDRLVSLGITPTDATFLIQHPSAAKPVRERQLSEATVIAAMIDGILTQDQAEQKLVALNLSIADARLYIQEALVKQRRGPKARQAKKLLSEASIIEAFKLGLARDTWAERELEVIGYSTDDAQLLVTIEETKLSQAIPPAWTVLN